ncbi:cyclic AMP-dependent transcription factor ATF-4 [Anarrhichthys ocellatus]|uniref:cyclic AMP-dependent transcription factor ATF-4 n=1 Tax=Anarrhichthys ocellatus TaxID=433405 RepID=UPI0012EE568D|nr:cyclic AMP-dependent transcription factor ATF-4-like [Anarrhichthys ocellatus]
MTLCLEAVEALYLGPSFLTADPMGPPLDQHEEEEEEALSPSSSLEGKAPASPPFSFTSFLSPASSTPPTHPSLFLGTKAGGDSSSLPWLGASDLLDAHIGADDDDAFAGMDWMSEKIDLSEFDLDSLIGSSDECPGSPEDLLASLDSHVDLDVDSFDATAPDDVGGGLELGLSLPGILELPLAAKTETEVAPDQQVVTKSEPPPSLAFTLELGSEVDVLDADKTLLAHLTAPVIPDPSGTIQTISLVVVLTTEDEPPLMSVANSPVRLPKSPTAGSSRTKPYSRPEPSSSKTPKVKSVSGAPKVEKKLKKMEQNKTAATRYRQKKRVEHSVLNTECEELEKRNNELAEKAESISREIQYLKDLMEEVRKRRVKSRPVA